MKTRMNSSNYIININRLLKNIKSECKVNYIGSEKSSVVIVTNKITSALDLQTIKWYVKIPCLPQSKLYLKIISLSYFMNNSKTPVSLDIIEDIIKNNHIFNDINIASRPKIIKVLLKLDMVIIWLDVWNSQNRTNAKRLKSLLQCWEVYHYYLWSQHEPKCLTV